MHGHQVLERAMDTTAIVSVQLAGIKKARGWHAYLHIEDLASVSATPPSRTTQRLLEPKLTNCSAQSTLVLSAISLCN